MSHCNIQDPETGLWNCWSTMVDDYLFEEWLPEDRYKVAILTTELHHSFCFTDEDFDNGVFDNIIDYTIAGNTCTITINDINKIKLDRSKWYTKEDCDAKLARMQKCKKCNHKQCEDCDDGDHFVPGEELKNPDEVKIAVEHNTTGS